MKRCTFFGSALSAAWARAIGPVSGCDRYSMPAGDLYCTVWPNAGIDHAATRAHTEGHTVTTNLRVLDIPAPCRSLGRPRDWLAFREQCTALAASCRALYRFSHLSAQPGPR